MSDHPQATPALTPRSVPAPLPLPLARLTLNLITVGTGHDFEAVLDACQAHGIHSVSPWQDHYAAIGVEAAARALQARGMSVSTLCRMTGFGSADTPAAWQQAIDNAQRVIDDAAALRAASVTVIGGGLAEGSSAIADTRQRISDGIQAVLPAARAAGVGLAIEPLHPMVAAERGAVNTLKQAVQLAQAAGLGAGVMVDAYNCWWDPELAESVASARGLIMGFQVADWLVPTTDLAFDRGMPGDGIIDLQRMRALLESAGYQGQVEVEVLSRRWSGLALQDVLATVVQRCAKC